MEQAINLENTGLDLDNNLATIVPGDSPFRYNLRYGTTERSDLGGLQNTKGSTLIQMKFEGGIFVQPPGENEVIGSCKDTERDAIIYFVWNQFNQHQIRRLYTQSNRVQVILESPVLNFRRGHKINHANVVDNTLSWTDGWIDGSNEFNYNGPRQIDMNRAYGFMLNNPWPNGYTQIDVQTLDAIRYAPGTCPTFQYVNNLNFNDNRLYGNLFQFAYRYVYYDNSISVLSPISKITLPQGEDIEGNYDLTTENQLNVTTETGHYTAVRIELIAKVGTSYRVVEVAEKYDTNGVILIPSDSTYTFEFFNTKFIQELTLEEAQRTQDLLPQVADVQEVLSSKQGARRIYGAYTEGYANVQDTGLSVAVKIEKIDPTNKNYKNISFKHKGTYQVGRVYADKAGRKSFVQTSGEARITIPWWRSTELINDYYDPADEWILSTHQKPYIEWQLNSAPPAWADTYQIVCSKNLTAGRYLSFYQFGCAVGDNELFCYNEGKSTLYIPPQLGYDFTEGDRLRIICQFDNSIYPYLGVNIATTLLPAMIPGPPINSAPSTKFHRVLGNVTALNSIHAFEDSYWVNNWQTYNDPQGKIWDLKIKKFDVQNQRIFLEGDIELDIASLYKFEIYNSTSEISDDSKLYFEVGETYKIINGQHSVTSGIINGIDTFVRNEQYKFQPLPYNVRAAYASAINSFRKEGLPNFFYVTNAISLYSQAGVYSGNNGTLPSQNGAYVLVSGLSGSLPGDAGGNPANISSTYKVKGSISVAISGEQTLASIDGDYAAYFCTVNPQGTINKIAALFQFPSILQELFQEQEQLGMSLGNKTVITFFSPRSKINIEGIITESESYSPFYESNTDQTGRPYIINKEAVRRKYFANMIFGGPVFDNTLVNFFSRYLSTDVVKLNEQFNEITRIQEVGFMLKVRQRNKSTSIYVGRSELSNQDGTTNLAATNNVLGTINPSDEIWGGTHPGSDTRSIRDTYFFDAINGVLVRDATNGLVAISGNKNSPQDPYRMTSFFRDLADWVRRNEANTEIISAWDENTTSYFFTVRRLRSREADIIPDFVEKYNIQEAWNGGLTLSFHEPSNRWQLFHPFVPEWYGQVGNAFVSFRNGEAWLHYTNETRGSYFGITYPFISEQICNQYTNNIKVFDNIDIHSNVKWFADLSPDDKNIYILPNAQFPNGMRSKLPASSFRGQEGKWNASFLNDMNTPGIQNELLALINGRKLRGEAMKIRLRNTDNDKDVFLRQVIFHFTPSEISG